MIDHELLQTTLDHALRTGGDFAEVFVEDRRSGSGRFDDGRVEELVSGRDRGAGLRVVRGDTTGFAHTADLSEAGLTRAAEAAAGAARSGGGGTRVVPLHGSTDVAPDASIVLPETIEKRRKVELLARADAAAREEGSAITSVTASYADARRRIVVANSDGLLTGDDQVRTRMMVQCVATGDTGMQTGYEAPGRSMGFELFDQFAPEDVGRKAARRALTLLDAAPAPSGKIPVVLKRGAGGVLFHEACGHGLEADHIQKDASVFRGQVGRQVASPLVTLVDDGTYGREWGTIGIDDEGHAARRNVLIEDGVLTEYMWDVVRARKDGRDPSGNGRRESYRHLPMPRMTNTFLLEGASDPDDIIRGVDYGIYCVQLGGGQVDPATGDFVFGITEAYLIERGEITHPIRAAQLIGNGPDVLRMVDAVGNDFETWTGMCGKQGQSVPVSSGQPTVLVREMTVGGTAGVSVGTRTDLLDIARGVAGAARPGEQVEAYVVRTQETDVEVFGGNVESLTIAGIEGIGVRVIADHRQGLAWAGSLDPDVIADTLRDARDNAGFGEPDEFYGVASPNDVGNASAPDLDLWRDDLLAVPTDEKVRIALDLERATLAADSRIRNVESASYGDSLSEMALVNSLGVEGSARRTTCAASSVALADDGSGTQSGYGFAAGRTLADLDLDAIPRDAAVRSCRLLGAKPVPGRRIPVILDPLVTRSVLGVLTSAFNGESMLKGRSLFTGRLDEQVAAPHVQLLDDPTDARAMGASQFDGDGVPTRCNPLIVDGVLVRFLHNVYTGRRSGTGTTASATRGFASTPGVGVRALRLEPGTRSPEEIMRLAGDAFYVQSVSGLHSGTNPISGDFSVGADGLMVRDGAFAEPVREVTIASTLQRMLLDIAEIGCDLTFLPGAVAGMTVLVSEMTLSGA